jgi:hypothetical protein
MEDGTSNYSITYTRETREHVVKRHEQRRHCVSLLSLSHVFHVTCTRATPGNLWGSFARQVKQPGDLSVITVNKTFSLRLS